MSLSSERWKEIARSEFPWEQEALAFLRDALPDRDPYRAWSNFEFIADDGSVNEVDVLVLTPKGLFLVEIKSRPGMVTGDAGTWVWHHDNRQVALDNPVLLANRKAKRLASLLRRQKACAKMRVPFVEPLVFLSAPHLNCQLDGAARQRVHVRDAPETPDRPARPGVVAALTHITPPDPADPRWRPLVDAPVARALSRAMEEAGIRPSQKQRRVADFVLQRLLFEGPNYQDWEARHATLERVSRRVRIYLVARGASEQARGTIARAAQREFQILEGIQHPGILRALTYHEHELGPALVFEHDPGAMRLDHFLVEHARRLDADLRLGLLRQLAEALQYAHKKRLVHRALSPQSVLVLDPDAASPRMQVFNWQTAAREYGSTPSRGLTVTQHLGDLVEPIATAYMAPEALTDPQSRGEQLDVFGLGAIAYHLFAGKPPADSLVDLGERLREGKGLQIASALNGAGEHLSFLIQYSTHPEVSSRLDSVSDFLDYLERVEEELTKPDEEPPAADPVEAKAGERLEGGFIVKKRLGKGSTAMVFLVEKDGREQVLKLALAEEHNARLLAEGEVLRKLRHQSIVELYDTVRLRERVGLLMAKAGDQTLAQRLRSDGRLHLDLLQRFGENLLQAVDWLEQKGIPHRDIKPDNIGIAPLGLADRLQLVLFDFSLSRTPLDRIRAGTVPYLDPFLSLRRPPRWDVAAERFAAAMTLHEMATGTLPRWGDGKSDPAVLDCEATLDTDLFDASVREPLAAFFAKALRRDAAARFDNAEEMLREWRQVFAHVDEPAVATDHAGADAVDTAVAGAALDTPLITLGLSTRAINALERVDAQDVSALLRLGVTQISHMRGVGHKTRRELLDVKRKLEARFPAAELAPRPARDDAEPLEPGVRSVDMIAERLVPAGGRERGSETPVLRLLLGLDDGAGAAGVWRSQTDVAEAKGITRARVGQIVAGARERWSRLRSLAALRDEIPALLEREGGAMTAAEATTAVLLLRGSAREEPLRSRLGLSVVRAATEAESKRSSARWIVSRAGHVVVLALDEALADYAEQLGRVADRLAATDPLPSPARVLEELQRIAVPAGRAPLAPTRLLKLAASASRGAAVSSRLEIYPRGMSADRALKLSQGALLGARELTEDQVRSRVMARYPEAGSLPGRPMLDELLMATGSHLSWFSDVATGRGVYRAPTAPVITLSSSSTSLPRQVTADVPGLDASPEVALARQIEERLQRSARDGGFLALTVEPRYLERAERELTTRFAVEPRSLDAALIRAMRTEAQRAGADWDVVLRADAAAPGSTDWRNLLTLVGRAVATVEDELAKSDHTILLTHAGILARYDEVACLERLGDRVGRRDPGGSVLHGLWVLIPSDDPGALPALDGKAVPLIGPTQWARLSAAWLENAHRGR